MAGKLYPLFRERGQLVSRRRRSCAGKAVGGVICRNPAGLYRAPAARADRLAGGGPRCRSRKNSGADAPPPLTSMDTGRSGEGGRGFTLGAGGAFSALSGGPADGISHPLAASTWRPDARVNQLFGGPSCGGSRLRIRSSIQPRL